MATNWTAGIPNSTTADAVIDAAPGTAPYTVTIATGASDVVNSLTLNPDIDVSKAPYLGAILEVDGALTFAPGSSGALDGPLQSMMFMNNGQVVNGGTLNAFVQAGGISNFTGTNAIYFTNWLQSIGITTIDTTSIGEYTPATRTLFDGIFEAKGDGTAINLGGAGGNNIVNIATIVGPKPTPTPNFWTEIIMDGPTSSINEWNGAGYVPLENSLTNIGGSAMVSLTGGRNYITANPLTVEKDGTYAQTSGTLTTAGLTIQAGGTLTDGVPAFYISPGAVVPGVDKATLTVTGNVVNNGTIHALPAGILLQGPVSGTGTMNFGQGGGTIEVAGSVSAGQNVVLSGSDTLVVDNPALFKGSIADVSGANTVVLKGVTATQAVLSGGSLVVSNAGTTVAAIATSGTLPAVTVTTTGGNATIQLAAVAPSTDVVPPGAIAPLAAAPSPSFLAAPASTAPELAAPDSLASVLSGESASTPAPVPPAAAPSMPDSTSFAGQLLDPNAGGVMAVMPDRNLIG